MGTMPGFDPTRDAAPVPGPEPISILLAEDHAVVRQGVRAIFEAEADFHLVGETDGGLETVRRVRELSPDVLVLDLMMPKDVSGLEVARQVRQQRPETRIVVLTMHADEPYVVEALRAGAVAYVLKAAPVKDLVHAVREAHAGRRYLSPPLDAVAIADFERRTADWNLDLYETLTTREREVLQLAVQGRTNGEIADSLNISRRTVETHRASFMRKLELRNPSQLHAFAARRGLVPRPPQP